MGLSADVMIVGMERGLPHVGWKAVHTRGGSEVKPGIEIELCCDSLSTSGAVCMG